MEKIKRTAEQIHRELECAEHYAEEHIQAKADGNFEWAERVKLMADDELRHSLILHEYAVSEIEKLEKHYRPTSEMEDRWNHAHKEFTNKYEWIKELLR